LPRLYRSCNRGSNVWEYNDFKSSLTCDGCSPFQSTGKMTPNLCRNYATLQVKGGLAATPGWDSADIFSGSGDYAMRVWRDRESWKARGLTAADLSCYQPNKNARSCRYIARSRKNQGRDFRLYHQYQWTANRRRKSLLGSSSRQEYTEKTFSCVCARIELGDRILNAKLLNNNERAHFRSLSYRVPMRSNF